MGHHKDPTPEQRERYRTSPAASFVAYFHPKPRRPGDLYRNLLELCAESLGDMRVAGQAFRRVDIAHEQFIELPNRERHARYYPKLPSTIRKIASSGFMDELNDDVAKGIFAEQQSLHQPSRQRDLVWALHYHDSTVNDGMMVGPMVHMHVTFDRLRWKRRSMREFVCEFFSRCAEDEACFFGLVDPARTSELMWTSYHNFTAGSVSLQRTINSMAWMALGERRASFVRDLYWGNFYPRRVVDRFGGFEALRKKWLGFHLPNSQQKPWCELMPHGGAFVSLTHSPRDLGLFGGIDYPGIAWLRRRLGDEGLLA